MTRDEADERDILEEMQAASETIRAAQEKYFAETSAALTISACVATGWLAPPPPEPVDIVGDFERAKALIREIHAQEFRREMHKARERRIARGCLYAITGV